MRSLCEWAEEVVVSNLLNLFECIAAQVKIFMIIAHKMMMMPTNLLFMIEGVIYGPASLLLLLKAL